MADQEKWHIGRDGQPHKCTAKKKCPLGGTHYPNREEALKAAERTSRVSYTKAVRSLSKAREIAREDPENNKGVIADMNAAGVKAKRSHVRKVGDTGDTKTFPVRRIRQSAADKEAAEMIRDDWKAAQQAAREAKTPLEKMAVLYASRDALQEDFNDLKNDLRTQSDTFSDMAYEHSAGVMYVESYGSVDQSYLKAQGIDPSQFYRDSPERLDSKKLREGVKVSYLSKELGVDRGDYEDKKTYDKALRKAMKEKGWKAADRDRHVDSAIAASGVVTASTTYKPDRSQYASAGGAYERHYVSEPGTMSSSSMRAGLLAVGQNLHEANELIRRSEAALRKKGQRENGDPDFYFKKTDDPAMSYKSHTSYAVNEDAANEWISNNGGSTSDYSSSRHGSSVSVSDWKAYATEHHLNYWAAITPRRRVSYVGTKDETETDEPIIS